MSKEKTVYKVLEEVTGAMCDNYFKYPEVYLSRYKDPDEAYDVMGDEQCQHCPLSRLI